MNAITAATNLLDRIRDVGGLSLSSAVPPSLASGVAYAKRLISVAQRHINTLEQNQIDLIPFTTTPQQTLYNIDSDAVLGSAGTHPIIKIVGIQDDASGHGRDIIETPFRQIYTSDFGWFRRVGPVYTAWSYVGRDCFILYPALASATQVGIVAVPYLADLIADGDLFTVTDDLIPQVMDLAEVLALFKIGEYKLAASPLARLQASYKEELAGDAWRKQMSSRM